MLLKKSASDHMIEVLNLFDLFNFFDVAPY